MSELLKSGFNPEEDMRFEPHTDKGHGETGTFPEISPAVLRATGNAALSADPVWLQEELDKVAVDFGD